MSVYSTPFTPRHYAKLRKRSLGAFTLIELLMVIAIIGILAGILIPVVGTVKERANIAASKTQISGYINAINMFKGEYNYYPFATLAGSDEKFVLDTPEKSKEFIIELSARDPETYDKSSGVGNRRQIEFYSFSESDYLFGDPTTGQIADRFDNVNINILIDIDGDGRILDVPDPENPGSNIELRTKVSAYVEAADNKPDYYLYQQ